MADFNLIFTDDQDVELIASVDETAFNGMLSDEAVMEWLMDLEDEDTAIDLDESRRESHTITLHV
jgi:hypothetical protein